MNLIQNYFGVSKASSLKISNSCALNSKIKTEPIPNKRTFPREYIFIFSEELSLPLDSWTNQVGVTFLFINSKTGQATKVDFPNYDYSQKLQQIKIDSLGINCLLISAKTVDLNERKGIDWNDPTQIFIFSPDGSKKTQLTDSKLYVSNWTVNKITGTLIVTGFVDSNNNGKYDKTDKSEIGIYDLRTLTLVQKL